jgi:glutamate dehydrogenase
MRTEQRHMLQTALANPTVIQAVKTARGRSVQEGTFAQLLFRDAQADDLDGMAPATLDQISQDLFAHYRIRMAGTPEIYLQQFGSSYRLTVINDDMPFLVDSTLALLAERGLEVSLVLHPVIKVRRSFDGNLVELAEVGSVVSLGASESLIYIHFQEARPGSVARLQEDIEQMLLQVRRAVLDWRPMRARIEEAILELAHAKAPATHDEINESLEFLRWILDNHFTFLGLRVHRFEPVADGLLQSIEPDSALGILRDPDITLIRTRNESLLPADVADYLQQRACLILTKTDAVSWVHRRAQMDYCGVKLYNNKGALVGELSVVGLFTSSAYTESTRSIPLVRQKLDSILSQSGFPADSHSGKALLNVLETYPRDELLQTSREELEQIAAGILQLEERPRTRLFLRSDHFDRFVAAFVFLPRDRFNTDLREKIGHMLAEALAGEVAFFQPTFGDGPLVRVHYMIRRIAMARPPLDLSELQNRVSQAARSWSDRLMGAYGAADAEAEAYAVAFPAGYRDLVKPEDAVEDLKILKSLKSSDQITARFSLCGDTRISLRLHRLGQAIPLADRLPILENMGLRAIEETTYTITPRPQRGLPEAFIHDVILEPKYNGYAIEDERFDLMRKAFLAVWRGRAENDGFNALVLIEGMSWREASLLRALGRYLRQTGISFSNIFLAKTLIKYPAAARLLLRLFTARFDPAIVSFDRQAQIELVEKELVDLMLSVTSLDEDRVLRRFTNLIGAMQRSNYFVVGSKLPLAFKFFSRQIETLPEPRPYAEIFVYSPDVEGVHLRFGKIARGGIRWSDRPEDFRTEVLGLVKAQNVKNTVIVPVGAKGGFVSKRQTLLTSREAIAAEGLRCYRLFIESLLSLTDNIQGGQIVPPQDVVRHDGDDPYLVVAADKGTASFSDEANSIAQHKGFWLDDAFASGGSIGYDHKKMGITAHGAFVAVERHFREMDRDIHVEPVTVAGVGDMSGDVFGNGMLLSRQIRLQAAFDHRDIFLDPEPNAELSFQERTRLFHLTRSSWQDYDRALISEGGGIYSRSAKSIPLSPAVKAMLDLEQAEATPAEIVSAILRMQVDLLWFGGIGTFVKARAESHAQAGDKANDFVRVNGREVRAKVVGEGANLGFTQLARVEYALAGGRINSDAVDNSAGVNTSDYEVNIKIALGRAEQLERLQRGARDQLLVRMTDGVAALVLRNNQLQTLCLTLARARASEEVGYDARVIRRFETQGLLNRALEFLPDDTQLKERELRSQGLTRPELAVLMAYAKFALHEGLLDSKLPDDPYFEGSLSQYFPVEIADSFAEEIRSHRLRREIISMLTANSMVNRLGPSFSERIIEETAASADDLARAYVLARESFGFRKLQEAADFIGAKGSYAARLELLLELQLLLRRGTVWFLRHADRSQSLAVLVDQYRTGLDELGDKLSEWLPEAARQRIQDRFSDFVTSGIAPDVARHFANLRFMQRGPDVVQVARLSGKPLSDVARVLYATNSQLGIERIVALSSQMKAADFYERIAINRLLDQLFQTHRNIVTAAVTHVGGPDAWWGEHAGALRILEESLADMTAEKSFSLARLSVAASDLAALV